MIVVAGVDGDEETVKGRDIYVCAKGGVGNLQRVDELHQSVDALSFPLMFPSSDPGYNTEMKHRKPPSLGGGGEQGPANAQGNVGMAEQDWDAQDGTQGNGLQLPCGNYLGNYKITMVAITMGGNYVNYHGNYHLW